MQNLKKLIPVAATCAVLALTGCEMFNHGSSDRTAGRELDDKTISANVRSDLDREPVYKFDGVNVQTFDGVVQLSGFVDTDAQKHRAGEIAQQVQGVVQVDNNIAMKPQNQNIAPTGRDYNNNVNPPPNPPAQ